MKYVGVMFIGLLISCSHQSSQSSAAPQEEHDQKNAEEVPVTVPADERLIWTLSHGEISCQPGSQCFENIALIQAQIGDSVRACGGFLIDKTRVATNSHCLPKGLNVGDKCSGLISATFPMAKELKRETVGCSHIEIRTPLIEDKDKNILAKDYAVFTVDRELDRHPLKISFNLMPEQSIAFLLKVTPHFKNPIWSGTIELNRCKVQYLTSLPFIFLKKTEETPDCTDVNGNSGGTILDNEGYVHGLIQGIVTPELYVGTNLMCVKTPQDMPERVMPTACD